MIEIVDVTSDAELDFKSILETYSGHSFRISGDGVLYVVTHYAEYPLSDIHVKFFPKV